MTPWHDNATVTGRYVSILILILMPVRFDLCAQLVHYLVQAPVTLSDR